MAEFKVDRITYQFDYAFRLSRRKVSQVDLVAVD